MSHIENMLPMENKPQSRPIRRRSLWERLVRSWATRITTGTLTIEFPDGCSFRVKGEQAGPLATLIIHSPKFVWQVISGGKLGFARAYMDGTCDSPDIGALLDLGLANEKHLSSVLTLPFFARMMANFQHRRRANTKSGSKRNIAFHYDLGNQFYAHWLDETMTYSSGLFEHPNQPLSDAQTAKYARIVERLNIGSQDRVLEIGCGWGGFAEYAARETGCTVVGLTLSHEQAQFAQQRMAEAGLSQRVEIRIEDYRNCQGQFDKIVSIEMFEAVGEENWPIYFAQVKSLLSPTGEAMLQVITIDESEFEDYRQNADFIQTYIFPGGMLPSQEALSAAASEYDLKLVDSMMFGQDYEKTLLHWDQAFTTQWQHIETLGFDIRFKRMWRYYLHYCAAGFRAGRINVGQFHFRLI